MAWIMDWKIDILENLKLNIFGRIQTMGMAVSVCWQTDKVGPLI